MVSLEAMTVGPGVGVRQDMVTPGVQDDAPTAIYVAISCACAMATLMAIALLACYLRTNKARLHNSRFV